MIKQDKEQTHYSLFAPFTKRMAIARKQYIVEQFLKNGFHISNTGFSARIITDYCLKEGIDFTVQYHAPKAGIRSHGIYNIQLGIPVGYV